jgi:hypothetical protein
VWIPRIHPPIRAEIGKQHNSNNNNSYRAFNDLLERLELERFLVDKISIFQIGKIGIGILSLLTLFIFVP